MELVFINDKKVVTDSLTIAEVFGKEHKRVLQDIREIDCSLEFHEHNFVPISYKDSLNREKPKFIITEDGFTLLVMGYTGKKAMEFKENYIKEFRKMEKELAAQNNKSLQNYLSMSEEDRAIAFFSEVKERKRLEQEVKPKADMYDLIGNAKNNLSMGAVAKTLGYGRNKLFEFLREQNVLRYNNEPYQRFVDQGYFIVRMKPIVRSQDTYNVPQTFVTPKGTEYIAKLLTKNGLISGVKTDAQKSS